MVTNEPFKQFQHNVRNMITEETYEGGMMFQDTPIASGKNRVLVNYDIGEDGECLTTRDGYVASLVAYGDAVPDYPGSLRSKNGRECPLSNISAEENGHEYTKTILLGPLGWESYSTEEFARHRAIADNMCFAYIKNGSTNEWMYDVNDTKAESQDFDEFEVKNPGTMYSNDGVEYVRMMSTVTEEYQTAHQFNAQTEYRPGDCVYYEGMWYKCLRSASGDAPSEDPRWDRVGEEEAVMPASLWLDNGNTPIGCFAWENTYYYFDCLGRINRIRFDLNSEQYVQETMAPKQITSAEASQFGFNMLLDSPYEFYDSVSTGVGILGIMFYRGRVTTFDEEASKKLVTKPVINTEYTLRANYNGVANKSYDFTFYYKEPSETEYTLIKKVENVATTASTAAPAYTTFKCPSETAIIKVEVQEHGAELIQDVLLVGAVFSSVQDSSVANKDLQNYNLGDVANVTYWKNRLWLSGSMAAPNILFASDVNDPTYFPYPNNIDVYDDPIIATVPFDEYLMIFTTTKIIQLTLNDNGTWYNKLIQPNMNFTLEDKKFIQVVRNMLFFKSGDYFYMIVPRSLTVTKELALAPVSKNITRFLDNYNENAIEIVEKLYNVKRHEFWMPKFEWRHNFIDYEDIHNILWSDVAGGEDGIVFDLIYNTSDRTWRTYIYRSPYVPNIIRQDATNNASLIMPLNLERSDSSGSSSSREYGLQIINKNKDFMFDFFVTAKVDRYLSVTDARMNYNETPYALDGRLLYQYPHLDCNVCLSSLLLSKREIRNYQMLDTGYRDQQTGINKRYRELQFKFNNESHKKLKFTTTFGIGGEMRVQDYEYHVELGQDGEMYIERTPVENLVVYGNKELNTWELSGDSFPNVDFWKARMRVSGKGYVPRIILTCRTEEKYNLLGYAWVSHQLYAR